MAEILLEGGPMNHSTSMFIPDAGFRSAEGGRDEPPPLASPTTGPNSTPFS
jgi:hypothetical protein